MIFVQHLCCLPQNTFLQSGDKVKQLWSLYCPYFTEIAAATWCSCFTSAFLLIYMCMLLNCGIPCILAPNVLKFEGAACSPHPHQAWSILYLLSHPSSFEVAKFGMYIFFINTSENKPPVHKKTHQSTRTGFFSDVCQSTRGSCLMLVPLRGAFKFITLLTVIVSVKFLDRIK